MLRRTLAGLAACATLGVAPSSAAAEDGAPYEIAVSAGGGGGDFVGDDVRASTGPSGLWDFRALFGSRQRFGVEAAYVGTATSIGAQLGTTEDGTLIGTGFEVGFRVAMRPAAAVVPYAVLGVGGRRYDISEHTFRTADTGVLDRDDVLEFPLAAGAAFRSDGVIADARVTYRITTHEDLLGPASLDTWAITARIGYEL